jgi:hypothetical protein
MNSDSQALFQTAVQSLGLPAGTVVTVSYVPTGEVTTPFTVQ